MEFTTPQGLSTGGPVSESKKSLLLPILIGSVVGIAIGAAGYFFLLSPNLPATSSSTTNTVTNNADAIDTAGNWPTMINGNLHLLALKSQDIPESWDTFYCCAGTLAGYVNLPGTESRFSDENMVQQYNLQVTGLEEGQLVGQEITEYATEAAAQEAYDNNLSLLKALAEDEKDRTIPSTADEGIISGLGGKHFLYFSADDDTALHQQLYIFYLVYKNIILTYDFQVVQKITRAEVEKVIRTVADKFASYQPGTDESLLAQQTLVDQINRDGIRINGAQHVYVSLLELAKSRSGSAPYPTTDGSVDRDADKCPTRINCQAGILTGGLTALSSDQLMPPAGSSTQESFQYDTVDGQHFIVTVQLEGYDKNWIYFNDLGDVGWVTSQPTCVSNTACPAI